MSNDNNYLKQDLLTLLALGVIITGVLAGLWYTEQHGGQFSRMAAKLLDSGSR